MGAVAIFKGKLVKFLAKAGIIFPSRSDEQRSASPTPGEAAFNTTSNKLEVYDGSTWVELAVGFSHPTTGSTFEDGKSKTNMTGTQNTSIGFESGDSITTGYKNAFYGTNAGTTIGTGINNTFLGANAGSGADHDDKNSTVIGADAGIGTVNQNNILIGAYNCRFSNLNGMYSVSIGTYANEYGLGANSVIIGYGAGSVMGQQAFNSTILGYQVGGSLTTGKHNLMVGADVGRGISTGSYNTIIGTRTNQPNMSGCVAIGQDSVGSGASLNDNNDFVLGVQTHNYKLPGTIVTDVKLGSNVALKLTELAENGNNTVSLKAPDAIPDNVTWTLPATDGSDKQALTTDGSGALSWMTTIPATFEGDAYKVTTSVYSPTLDTVSGVVNANLGSSFRDTNTGNRTIAVHNLKDGQSVNIMVQGAINDVITITAFSDSGVTSIPVKYGAGQNGVMASTYSLFAIYRIGGAFDFVTVGPVHGIT